jgi:hypothetical protein
MKAVATPGENHVPSRRRHHLFKEQPGREDLALDDFGDFRVTSTRHVAP